jgi:putative ABC transport system ATP-binding protein
MYILTNVVKNYSRGRQAVAALRGVDLVVRDSEWLAIQGPAGHGKSTLLQIMGALDRPNSGSVELGGIDLSTLREAALTRIRARSIGFVFQTFNLIPTLNAAALTGSGPGHRARRAPLGQVKMICPPAARA